MKFYDHCDVIIKDVNKFLKEMEWTKANTSDNWFDAYHDYSEIMLWYEELSERYSNLVTYEVIGESVEGRPMPALHITDRASSEDKKKIYFQCQTHAREWITGAVCMFIVDHLLSQYGHSERVTNLLERLEFLVVPFVNPDGYEYTWTTDRLWRKNRAVIGGSNCMGVDLNRNYDEHWAEGGSSDNPCSDTYHGPSPFSEPETMHASNFFLRNTPILGAIDWHSYSQLILRPFGWTADDAPDEVTLKALGDRMSEAAYEVHGKEYVSQKAFRLYPTSGTARDWFYGEQATSFNKGYRAAGYTVELRDTGQYGFLLPPDQIIPNGEEMVAGALAFAEFCFSNPIIDNVNSTDTMV
jgi:hypothetical protein